MLDLAHQKAGVVPSEVHDPAGANQPVAKVKFWPEHIQQDDRWQQPANPGRIEITSHGDAPAAPDTVPVSTGFLIDLPLQRSADRPKGHVVKHTVGLLKVHFAHISVPEFQWNGIHRKGSPRSTRARRESNRRHVEQHQMTGIPAGPAFRLDCERDRETRPPD